MGGISEDRFDGRGSVRHGNFLKIGIHDMRGAEQPLQGMELQEKSHKN